jgi:hypothetical protein
MSHISSWGHYLPSVEMEMARNKRNAYVETGKANNPKMNHVLIFIVQE